MMKLHPLKSLLAGSVLALAALGASAEEAAAAPDVAAPPAIPADVTDRIDARFLDYQTEQHVPGLVWGIVKDGELVYFKTSGVANLETEAPVTADSLFSIASMSKAFTALAILKLRDEGKLYLDAPAEYYVPELRGWTYPTTDSPRIRVRDLLAHVSGLVTDNPWGDRQQDMPEEVFTEVLKEGVPFSRAPQMAYEYSNFGYALLGRIVTNVSGSGNNWAHGHEVYGPVHRDVLVEAVRPASHSAAAPRIGLRCGRAPVAVHAQCHCACA